MSQNCNHREQQARQDRLEAAYRADGRHDPAHPKHSTYTGLANSKAYANTVIVPTMNQTSLEDLLVMWWRDSYPHAAPINNQTANLIVAFAAWVLAKRAQEVKS